MAVTKNQKSSSNQNSSKTNSPNKSVYKPKMAINAHLKSNERKKK